MTDDLRRLLLDAAREILGEPDTAFDLRKIAERAGKSRTAPYLVFGKTDEGGGLAALRMAVAAEGLTELVDAMERALGEGEARDEGLDRLAAAYLTFAQEHPRLFRLMFSPEVGHEVRLGGSPASGESPQRPEHEALRRAHRRLERTIVEAIRVQAPGYLRDDPDDGRPVASALWAMLHGVATLSIDQQWGLTRPEAAEDPDVLARQILRFLTTASTQAMLEVAEALERARALRGKESGPEPGRVLARRVPAPLADAEPGARLASIALDAEDAAAPQGAPTDRIAETEALAAYASSAPRSAAAPQPPASSLLRARQRKSLVEGALILWVDDEPSANRHEVAVLEKLGASVFQVRSTSEARSLLLEMPFDLIISDIARYGDPRAGLEGLRHLRAAGRTEPVIFYVGRQEEGAGTPPGAFGLTNDPDELLHLVFDVLERR